MKHYKFKRLDKSAKFFACICCFLIFALTFILSVNAHKAVAIPIAYGVVVIDAGHGGIDGGVVGKITKVSESEINLQITKKLKTLFEEAGFEVVLTRQTSAGLYGYLGKGHKRRDMNAREKIIKNSNPTLVVSIHQNSFSSSSRRGAQVFYGNGKEEGKQFALAVQNQLNSLKDNGRKSSPLAGDYFLLNISPCPAIIVECGFLSNPQDEKLLLSDKYQSQLASALFNGTLDYLIS